MEQQERLFPVQIAYSAYGCMAICTVTVEGTTPDDLVVVTVRSVGQPAPARPQPGVEDLPGNLEDCLNDLMRVLARIWIGYWRPPRYADYRLESSSHTGSASLIANESLHIQIERAGWTCACGMVVYRAGAFDLLGSWCKGVRISFEKKPRDPVLPWLSLCWPQKSLRGRADFPDTTH